MTAYPPNAYWASKKEQEKSRKDAQRHTPVRLPRTHAGRPGGWRGIRREQVTDPSLIQCARQRQSRADERLGTTSAEHNAHVFPQRHVRMSRGPQVLPQPAPPPPERIAARPVVHPLPARHNTLFSLSLTPRTFPRRFLAFPLFPYSLFLFAQHLCSMPQPLRDPMPRCQKLHSSTL